MPPLRPPGVGEPTVPMTRSASAERAFCFGAGASTCRPFPCPPLLSASVPLPSALVHSGAAHACLPLAVRARPPAARAARPFAPRPAVPLLPAPPFSMLSAPPFCPVPVRPLAACRCFGRFRGGSFRPAAPVCLPQLRLVAPWFYIYRCGRKQQRINDGAAARSAKTGLLRDRRLRGVSFPNGRSFLPETIFLR